MDKPAFIYVLHVTMALRSLESARKDIYRASLESSALFNLTADGVAEGYFVSELYPRYLSRLSSTIQSADAVIARLEERHYDLKRLAEFRQRLEPFRRFVADYPTGSAYLEARLNAADKTRDEEFHLQRGRQQKALDDLLAGKIPDGEVSATMGFIAEGFNSKRQG